MLGERHLKSAGAFLSDCLAIESGVTGFAPYVESDADNTARAISTLCLLKKPVSPSGLLIRYETREHFKTYTQDRTPSFRTNCLVLKALLDLVPENRDQTSQIEKCVKFITNCWWTTNGQVEDTWNVSPNYATMLMADALTRLVDLWEQGLVPILDDLILRDKVFVCLFQALTRTMQTQNSDGSWGHSGQRCETTAYATLTLAKLSTFSSAPRIKIQLGQALEQGRKYLTKNFKPSSQPDHVWNSKTTCGSSILFQAHVISALQAPARIPRPGQSLENRFEVPVAKIAIQTKYYSRQPWFANVPEWQIQAFLVESYLFLPQLRDVRFSVFPKENLTDDQYFDSIPFAWIAASTVERRFIGAEFLYQMMTLSFLNRQFEEYVTDVIGQKFAGTMNEIEDEIQGIYDELEQTGSKDEYHCSDHDRAAENETATLSSIRSVLHRFITHILNHPYVLMASQHDQEQLHSELLFYLLGRIGQQLSQSKVTSSAIEDEALARTIGSTASDQTTHQYTFAFLTCLVGNQSSNGAIGMKRDFLETPEQQYLVADICRRLSILSFVTARAAQDNAPQAPYREAEAHPEPRQTRSRSVSFGESDNGSVHSDSAMSSVSAGSSSYSDSSSPISPASSVSSAPSRSPQREMFVKQAQSYSSPAMSQPEQHTQQLLRLLAHERKCLNICLESLLEAGIVKRTTNVLKLFVDVSELSEQIFHDPNVGSYQANIAHQIVQRASNENHNEHPSAKVETPPIPAKRTDRRSEKRGSVSAARAALEIAPLQPKRDSVIPAVPSIPTNFESAASMPGARTSINRSQSSERTSSDRNRHSKLSFLTANEILSVPSQDDISIKSGTSTTSGQQEWNLNKPPNHRASRSSIEFSRIERIMADIEGGNSRNSTLPVHPALRHRASEQFQPKSSNMFPGQTAKDSGKIAVNRNRSHTMTSVTTPYTTTIVPEEMHSARSFPKRKSTLDLDIQARRTSGVPAKDATESPKQARRRIAALSRSESKLKARARDAAIDRERKRASCLQARAMAEASRLESIPSRSSTLKMSASTPRVDKLSRVVSSAAPSRGPASPIFVDVATANASVSTLWLDSASSNGSAGWIKSPPPQSLNGALSPVEGKEQARLRRDSKWGGPKWKAPF